MTLREQVIYNLNIFIDLYVNKKFKYKFDIKANDRPHFNRKWDRKINHTIRIFYGKTFIVSFNVYDMAMGFEYFSRKLSKNLLFKYYFMEDSMVMVSVRGWSVDELNIRYRVICKLKLNNYELIKESVDKQLNPLLSIM